MIESKSDILSHEAEYLFPPDISNNLLPFSSEAGHMKISLDDSVIDGYRGHSDSYPSLKRVHSYSNISRKSFEDITFSDPRILRLQQNETAIRREMYKECTFRPRIKNLPVAYGPLKETGTPFVTRMEKWNKEKHLEIKLKKDMTRKAIDEQCSFRPKINKNSDRAVQEIRGMSPEAAHERLFKSSLQIIEMRRKLLEEESLKEEKVMESQCTFKPKLYTKDAFQCVQPKFDRPSLSEPTPIGEKYKSKDHSFTPQVNKVKANMSSAKIYLQTNVVERLSRPIYQLDMNDNTMHSLDKGELRLDGSNVVDAATFIGALQGKGYSRRASKDHSSGSSIPLKDNPKLTREEIAAKKEKLSNFYARQQLQLLKREERVKTLEKHLEPSFQPKVKAKVKKSEAVSFLARVNEDVQRRQNKEQMQEIEALQQYPFKPEINKKAVEMRSRTVFEMSRGDALRKEANYRMLKLKADQEELAGVTLHPAISTKAKGVGKSFVSLVKDENAQQYIEWLKEKEQKLKEKQEIERKRKEDAELAGCTFIPKTVECPAYIKRIKNSLDLVRAARSADSVQSAQSSRPDWR